MSVPAITPTIAVGPRTASSRMGVSMRELMNELQAADHADGTKCTKDCPEQAKDAMRRRKGQRMSISDTLRKVWKAAVPFFTDKSSRGQAWAVSVTILVLLMIQTRMNVWGTEIGVTVDNSIQAKDKKTFHRQLYMMVGWLVMSLPVAMLRRYLTGCFQYEWRRFITLRMLNDYIGPNQAYYRMKFQEHGIDNPDQRLGQDVGGFTDNSVTLIVAMLHGALTIINSAYALYHVSKELLAFVLGFSVLITFIQFGIFGSRLMFLQRVALAQEADLRFGLVRVREHAESIAFYQGEEAEKANCVGFFEDVIVTLYRKLQVIVLAHGTDTAAGQFANLLPYAIVTPMFFAGEISVGRIYQSINLFSQVFSAMATFVTQIENISDLGANAIRVQQFQEILESMKIQKNGLDDGISTEAGESSDEEVTSRDDEDDRDCEAPKPAVSGRITLKELPMPLEDSAPTPSKLGEVCLNLEHVTLRAPMGGPEIVSDLSIQLRAGESLLIVGESGCGKSSLLRAIGGLWASGSGNIERRGNSNSIFLPQEPYLCLGSLRENIMYPQIEADLDAGSPQASYRDSEVNEALQDASLEYLVARHGLDTDVDLENMLSGGEKQSLCFARILLRQDVDFAMLDEATSGMDEHRQACLYEQIQERVSCYVSVGHRQSLEKFHTHKLVLGKLPGGGCSATLSKLRDAQHSAPLG